MTTQGLTFQQASI